ncbi:baculoviral IAP repeat-containing protein 5.1-like [Eublepharis macularius]|uniref:Baculoviral IAP repeat-containing protein 5.1-like n=1 Tax=Eublepharis macularius TaxID=481883 RepID=A0AA97KQ78_EUBMA|nr:baculoviral IAP repeat-containing protein 5.1-like [Eublepharis macularius]
MELLLREIKAASEGMSGFKEMYSYENRLKTFAEWPFKENGRCTPENMAKAGFIHCPNASDPDVGKSTLDVAKCFFCLTELEGWEPDHDPWLEHTKRSKDTCGFLTLSKNVDDLTVEEYYHLEKERVKIFLCKAVRSVINSFEKEVAATRKRLVDHFVKKYQYAPELEKPS